MSVFCKIYEIEDGDTLLLLRDFIIMSTSLGGYYLTNNMQLSSDQS